MKREYAGLSFEEGIISFTGGGMHYWKTGTGSKVLVGFHGYGQDGRVFFRFADVPDHYIIYAFDLPFHGKTPWGTAGSLQVQHLVYLLQQISQKNPDCPISLLGISIGCRLCLSLLEQRQIPLEHVFLIAPDGLPAHSVYSLATRTVFGRGLFRFVINQSAIVLKFLGLLTSVAGMNDRDAEFIRQSLSDPKGQQKLQNTWLSLRALRPSMRRVEQMIDQKKIPVYFFIGTHDFFAPMKKARRMSERLDTVFLHILDKGHQLTDRSAVRQIAEYLKKAKC